MNKKEMRYKMDKQTFEEYVNQGILINIQKPKFVEYRTASVKCEGYTSKTKTMPVEVLITSYYAKPLYNLKK